MTLSIITRSSDVSITGRQPRGLSPAFSRASAAYQSDGRKVGVGVPRFETVDGRRGVLVEEGTTNLVANPAFIQGLDGWTRNQDVTLDHVVLEGKSWCKVTSNQAVSTPGVLSAWITVMPNTTYTFSLAGFVGQGTASVYAYVNGNVTSNVVWSRPSSRLGTSPSRKVETFNTGDNTKVRVGALWSGVAIGDWFVITEVQLEAKPYATSFVDGVRSREILTASGVLDPCKGTVECWCQLPYTGGDQYLFANDAMYDAPGHLHIHIGSRFTIRLRTTDNIYVAKSFPASAVKLCEWQHWALVYDADAALFDLYIDGNLVTNGAAIDITNLDLETTLHLSGHKGNITYGASGIRRNLRIHHRALSAEEIAAHAAGNIVANDCYHYPFNGNLWPAPGSLGAVVAPAITTRSGQVDVITRRASSDVITRPGKLEVIGR